MDSERSLFDYLYVMVKWRRLILGSMLGIAVLTAGVSLVLPESWTATTTLVPPEEDGDTFGLPMLLAEGMSGGLSALTGRAAAPAERLLTLLDSRRVLGPIVDRFDLVARYGAPHRDLAIEALREGIEKQKTRDGTITVKVSAATPQLAADMANALAAELDAANREGKQQQARALRLFLEERMRQGHAEYEASALALQRFQDTSGLVDVKEQTAATVQVLESVVLDLAELEAKLGVARRQLGATNEERRALELQADELRHQVNAMLGGGPAGETAGPPVPSLGPGLRALPELGREYARLALELRLKEGILSFLATRLEEARYKEALDTPTIQVLDVATPPAVRTSPRRALMVIVASLLGLVTSTVLAFVGESWGRLDDQQHDRLAAIRQLLSRPR